jgi:hypothetical protein
MGDLFVHCFQIKGPAEFFFRTTLVLAPGSTTVNSFPAMVQNTGPLSSPLYVMFGHILVNFGQKSKLIYLETGECRAYAYSIAV